MEPHQLPSKPLEDRLRGLILSNDSQASMSASQDVADASLGSQKAPKKRLNQAQRREMNAQLSIPVDVRQTSAPAANPRSGGNSFRGGQRPYQHRGSHHDYGNHHNPGPRQHAVPSLSQAGVQENYGTAHLGQHGTQAPDWRHRQHSGDQRSPRGGFPSLSNGFGGRGRGRGSQHINQFHTSNRQYFVKPEELANQTAFLDWLCHQVNAGAEIEPSEIAEKETFRIRVQEICRAAVHQYEVDVNRREDFRPETVELKCFGSLMSGFATKAADMDLGIVSPMSSVSPEDPNSPIPRIVEKALLDAGLGARLLSRTRVPIIKLCEQPDENLYNALVEERKKWERGLNEGNESAEEDNEGATMQPPGEIENLSPSEHKDAAMPGLSSKPRPWTLKQTSNQSLMGYYDQAKKVLRHLNARDRTKANFESFSPEEYVLLGDVCEAFVNGLHDEILQQRVKDQPSYSNASGAHEKDFRDLHGVFKIVEGENLATLYDNRPFRDCNGRKHAQSETLVSAWRDLIKKPGFGGDGLASLNFRESLHHTVDLLREVPAIKLLQLSQEQGEPAEKYHGRTLQIMRDLTGPEGATDELATLLLAKYVAGIYDALIREKVQEFAATTNGKFSEAVARKHKILELADAYKRALDQEFYSPDDASAVEAYIALLLHEPAQDDLREQPDDIERVTIRPTEDSVALIERMRQLPTPPSAAPNQPKDKYHDKLGFPKTNIGVQCDINFSAHLALQNTLLLRCYAAADPRVRPMVLFVKHWVRVRGINTSYRGSLSSYGYVLMVLHYLVNIAEPFVCPNLQLHAPPDPDLPPEALEGIATCKGYNVRFWRDEGAIRALADSNRLTQNHESLGTLLRGFFEYYAQNNMMSTANKRGFDWGREVVSLRTRGGLLTKQEKEWTGAKTVRQPESGLLNHGDAGSTETTGFKEVRNRYLFAIEDPFEIEHNVARTVTHHGIVAIRDEFRRAWRIIKSAGRGPHAQPPVENLLDDPKAPSDPKFETKEAEAYDAAFKMTLDQIHGG
ncbi:terminal uridylyltransferase [Microdochium nivale]|nr:terminal uridylyltransferase [Microdochium nivale]